MLSALAEIFRISRNVNSFRSSNNVVISTSLFCSISANAIKGVNKQEASSFESGVGNAEKVKTHRQECRQDLHMKARRSSRASAGRARAGRDYSR